MSFAIDIVLRNEATPILSELRAGLEDGTDLHRHISGEAETLTREHILDASTTRHRTAKRLGAEPTGYLERAAEGVSSRWERDAAVVVLGGDNEIFKRVLGSVEVRPRRAKHLTIPAKAAAYGKRAGEIDGLELIVFKREGEPFRMALGRRGADGSADVWFWLLRRVTLPQDRGLLPTDDQFAAAAELGAVAYLDSLT